MEPGSHAQCDKNRAAMKIGFRKLLPLRLDQRLIEGGTSQQEILHDTFFKAFSLYRPAFDMRICFSKLGQDRFKVETLLQLKLTGRSLSI